VNVNEQGFLVQLTATLVKITMQGDTEQSELRDSSLHLRNVHQEGVEVLTFSNILGLATLHHDRAPSCYGEQKII
jgi:hypothetical protein